MDTTSRTASHPHAAGPGAHGTKPASGNGTGLGRPLADDLTDVYPTALNTTGVATPRPQPAAPAAPAGSSGPAAPVATAAAPAAAAGAAHAAAPKGAATAVAAASAQTKPAAATPAAKGATAAKPAQAVAAAGPAGPRSPLKRRLVLGGVAALVLVAAIIGLFAWQPWKSGPPPLNTTPTNLATFANSAEFAKLPFDRQVAYLKQVNDKEDQLAQAFMDGKMTEQEYAKAKQAAHLGADLTHMKKYFERLPGKDREAYLDKEIIKKEEDRAGEPKQPKKKLDGTTKPVKVHAKDDERAKEIKRDDSEETAVIKTWPPDVQKQYQEYRTALRNRKKVLKDQEAKEIKELKDQKGKPAGQK